MMEGLSWEIKAPKASKLSAIERNLKRATQQSPNIILDSSRMIGVQDQAIHTLLIRKYKQQKNNSEINFYYSYA